MTKTTKSKTATTKTVAAFVVSNGSQIDLADISTTTLDALVDQMVLAAQGAYGANIRIAAKLNELMAFDWFDVEYQEVSDNAKALKPHKAAVLAGFTRAGHSNPSKAYADIRAYGRNLRAGLAPNGKTLADGSPLPAGDDAAGEGANPAKRSLLLRNTEELIKLYKANDGADNLPDKVAAAQQHIIAALAALGTDVRTIK